MSRLSFTFFLQIRGVSIVQKLRVSIWNENNKTYLMPCEVEKVIKKGELYFLKVKVLDPDSVLSIKDVGTKFFFGHPGKIIGYGILNAYER